MRHPLGPIALATAIAVIAVNLITLPSGVVWAIVLTAMAISVLVVVFADQRYRDAPTRRNPPATP